MAKNEMAHHKSFRDPSCKPWIGWLAVLVVVGVPCLPAVLQWFKHLSA